MKPYKFSSTATNDKPDTDTTRLLEWVGAGKLLRRGEKNRVAEILYGTFGAGSSTYKLAGWAWPMSECLNRYVVKQYDSWHEYYAPDRTSLRSVLHGKIQAIAEV